MPFLYGVFEGSFDVLWVVGLPLCPPIPGVGGSLSLGVEGSVNQN